MIANYKICVYVNLTEHYEKLSVQYQSEWHPSSVSPMRRLKPCL